MPDENGGRGNDPLPPDPGRDPRRDVETARETLRGQVQLILDAVPGAAFYPPGDPADLEYLYVEGRVLVRDVDVDRVVAVVGGQVQDAVVNGVSVVGLTGISTPDALARLDAALGEGVATPEHILYVCGTSKCCPADEPTPVDTDRPAPDLRGRGSAGGGVAVTVIDTGLVADLVDRHDWLAGLTGEPDPVDVAAIGPYGGHGTFVAGVVRTVAPLAEVFVQNLLNQAGAATETGILRALHRAMDTMPDIISMSAGCHTRNNVPPLAFEVFWQHRLQHVKGTAVIVAAGNDGDRRAFWPAAFDWTVSVGATDASGARASFSNFGSWVDLYTVGVDLVNAYPPGTFAYREGPRTGTTVTFDSAMARWSGTSFSTPLVAGMVAARMSRTGQTGALAARSVLRIARAHAVAGVGAVADPAHLDAPDPVDP